MSVRFTCFCGVETGRLTWHCDCGHHYPIQNVRCDRCLLSHRRHGVREVA